MVNAASFDGQDDFAYGAPANEGAGQRLKVSIFADRLSLRDQLREDVESAEQRVAEASSLDRLLAEDAAPLGDVVLLDCPVVDAETLAALVRLDERAARGGAVLVVSTSVDALDDVFGSLDHSRPQILVGPSRAERVIALAQALAQVPGRRVRELSDEDRMVLLRLTQQVTEIGERLNGLGSGAAGSTAARDAAAFRFEPPAAGQPAGEAGDTLVAPAKPQLPDPRMVRRIIRQRQLRGRFFDADLFADPAWDMLLDLTAAHVEKAKVSVTSLCIASGVPPTTALRWIGQMTEAGLLRRIEDETDRRRAFITLSDKAVEAVAGYFTELGNTVHRLV